MAALPSMAGDFNFHFASLGSSNARYEQRLDRRVFDMLQSRDGFHVEVRNQHGVATHRSGTIIDIAAASPDLLVTA